jgi:diguanylate cyclase (GGDEF)-like protein
MMFERAWSRLKSGASPAVGRVVADSEPAANLPLAGATVAGRDTAAPLLRAALSTQLPPPALPPREPAPAVSPAADSPRKRMSDLLASHGVDPQAASENARIRKLTCFDALTGLPNRLLFREQLDLVLRLAQRQGHTVAVLLADVDNFRRIKLSLGHSRSDELVKAVAQRLQSALRGSDLVMAAPALDRNGAMARLAGTEFAIVLSQLGSPQDAARVAQRLREAASSALLLGGIEIFPTVSIGIALSSTDGTTPELLLEHADLALGFAREQGRDRTNFYDAAMDATAASRIEIESGLRNALTERQFALEFQARVDGRTGVATSSEALLRWNTRSAACWRRARSSTWPSRASSSCPSATGCWKPPAARTAPGRTAARRPYPWA